MYGDQKDPNKVTISLIVGLGKNAYLLPKMEKRKSNELEDNIPPPSEDNETASSGEGEFLLAVRTGLATSAPHWSGSPHHATQHTPATRLGSLSHLLAVKLNRPLFPQASTSKFL